jgi:hypothetical protein
MFRIQHPELAIQNKEMIIGSAVHYVIEKYWNNDKLATDNLLSYLELNNITNREDINYAIHCTLTFFNNFKQYLNNDDFVEIRFRLPIGGTDAQLVGKIDRISNGNIFDWKTTRNPPKRLLNDLQFIVYNWAYKQKYNKNPVNSYYGSLSNGDLIMHNITGDSESYVFDELIPEVIHSIKQGSYSHTGVFAKSCFRCPYRSSCLKEELNELGS